MATRRSARKYTTQEVLGQLFDDSDDETDNLQELNGTVCESDDESDADDTAPSTAATELTDDADNRAPSTAATELTDAADNRAPSTAATELTDAADNRAPSTAATELIDDADNTAPLLPDEDDGLQEELNRSFQQSSKKSKLLTAKKLVNSLDACLEEGNFDAVDLSDNEKTFTSYLEKPKRKNDPGKKMQWTNQPPRPGGRQNSVNVIRGTVGVKGAAKRVTDPAGCWQLFFTKEMLSNILNHTNARITRLREQMPPEMLSDSRYCHVGITSIQEVTAFIGLVYLRGVLCQNNCKTETLFSDQTGHPVFSATMAKNRMKFLMANIRFDDESTRAERWQTDRFAAFREVFELFNRQCGKVVVPDDYISLDETLYPMRTQVSFKQFNPSKPAKYGLLFKSINAARYPYTFTVAPYSGKPAAGAGEYYVQGCDATVKAIVEGLERSINLRGRNISFDRLYTSIPLCQWLLDRGITSVGTLNSIRRGIPSEMKITEGREEFSDQVVWEKSEKRMSLHSYVVKKKDTGLRNVLMLSTMPPLLGVTKDDKNSKPAIYKLYDFTKGGTDIVDQRMGSYTCKTKTPRWTMAAFFYLLDTCRVNSCTVRAMNLKKDPGKENSFDYGWKLGMELVLPHIRARPLNGLTSVVQQKIRLMLGPSDNPDNTEQQGESVTLPVKSERRRRCAECLENIQGKGAKKRKDSLVKGKSQCQRCGTAICNAHVFSVCLKCAKDKNWDDYEAGDCNDCAGSCSVMGFNADKHGGRGSPYLNTNDKDPYCLTDAALRNRSRFCVQSLTRQNQTVIEGCVNAMETVFVNYTNNKKDNVAEKIFCSEYENFLECVKAVLDTVRPCKDTSVKTVIGSAYTNYSLTANYECEVRDRGYRVADAFYSVPSIMSVTIRLLHIGDVTFINRFRLKTIFLNHNLIKTVSPNGFVGFNSLDKIALEGNQLKVVPFDTLSLIRHSTTAARLHVILENNQISAVPETNWKMISNTGVNLCFKGNPFVCVGRIRWLVCNATTSALDDIFQSGHLQCTSPSKLAGCDFQSLHTNSFCSTTELATKSPMAKTSSSTMAEPTSLPAEPSGTTNSALTRRARTTTLATTDTTHGLVWRRILMTDGKLV
ncbi:PGBD4 [Branchiostoma lanceolatum]|uniref:PGBD4 protein n=1 Tax=Branchiostoma lanceolatum TaxID=7740 RepID=A0A8K0EKS2_BRALA|nr:PGBD4 [Branchiostoma lanceolatum]